MKNIMQSDYKVHSVSLGSGSPVVLIHGLGASLHHWDYLIPELVAGGYRAHALDLLGHGHSDKPNDPQAYHIDSFYQHAEAWIEGLPIDEPITLVGHSIGGYLSIRYSLRHPGSVNRVVLVDPYYERGQLSLLLRLAISWPEISIRLMEVAPIRIVNPLVKHNKNIASNLSDRMVQQMATDYKLANPFMLYTTPTAKDLTPKLGSLTQETLVIWGEKDQTLTPKSFKRLVKMLPNAHSAPLSQAGHTPHLTLARTFNQQVLRFFNGEG